MIAYAIVFKPHIFLLIFPVYCDRMSRYKSNHRKAFHMFYSLLSSHISDSTITIIAAVVACVATFVLYINPFSFLPRDKGKTVMTPDGKTVSINAQSAGKVTGAGFVFVSVFILASILFLPINLEHVIYYILMAIMMLIGFMDDNSKAPWGELVKGILDLALAAAASIVFVYFNGTAVSFFGLNFTIPKVLYVLLGIALIWGSINVTNCSDGVDGLCGGVSIVELMTFYILFSGDKAVTGYSEFSGMAVILSSVLVAYLFYNWFPSKILMGDAGSRTIGFFIALIAMKSGHPFIFIALSLVFLVDGGLGLLKLALMRTICKGREVFGNIRFPLHDEFRKNRGWKVPKVSMFFIICEVIICGIVILCM